MELINVVSVKPLPDYMLALEFEDGAKKLFDFNKELDFPPFRPLKNVSLFIQVKPAKGGIVWNEDIDIAAEYLYEHGVPLSC